MNSQSILNVFIIIIIRGHYYKSKHIQGKTTTTTQYDCTFMWLLSKKFLTSDFPPWLGGFIVVVVVVVDSFVVGYYYDFFFEFDSVVVDFVFISNYVIFVNFIVIIIITL